MYLDQSAVVCDPVYSRQLTADSFRSPTEADDSLYISFLSRLSAFSLRRDVPVDISTPGASLRAPKYKVHTLLFLVRFALVSARHQSGAITLIAPAASDTFSKRPITQGRSRPDHHLHPSLTLDYCNIISSPLRIQICGPGYCLPPRKGPPYFHFSHAPLLPHRCSCALLYIRPHVLVVLLLPPSRSSQTLALVTQQWLLLLQLLVQISTMHMPAFLPDTWSLHRQTLC